METDGSYRCDAACDDCGGGCGDWLPCGRCGVVPQGPASYLTQWSEALGHSSTRRLLCLSCWLEVSQTLKQRQEYVGPASNLQEALPMPVADR